MNRLKGIYHTLMFMWVGRFGGTINGGEYYLLKPIRVYNDATIVLTNITIHKLHNKSLFRTVGESTGMELQTKDVKWRLYE